MRVNRASFLEESCRVPGRLAEKALVDILAHQGIFGAGRCIKKVSEDEKRQQVANMLSGISWGAFNAVVKSS